jgi:hypothetical protein
MNTEQYNGWANYETWLLNQHLTNDYKNMFNLVEKAKYEEKEKLLDEYQTVAIRLANLLKERMEDELDYQNSLLITDLLQAALADVDWQEIAESFLMDWRLREM